MTSPTRLAFFDLDGTLKAARDPYAHIDAALGLLAECEALIAGFQRGEFDYIEWLRRDIALWKGIPLARVEDILRQNPYVPGAPEAVRSLLAAGVIVVLISTGPDIHARLVAADLGVQYWVANVAETAGGVLTGASQVRVAEGAKRDIVRRYLREFAAEPARCLAVGDGASDMDMFREVGLSVAINPITPAVAQAARAVLPALDLRPLPALLRRLDPTWPQPPAARSA
jgi:phosphoserine phosphatase